MTRLGPKGINRAVLARQLLLDRADVPVPDALGAVAGIQAQYAPAMYVGLWSRVAGLERDALTRMLEAREVVQATLMRITIHLVAPGDFWPLALAVRDARRAVWLRSRRGAVGEAEMVEAAATLRARLEDGGPMPRRDVEALVGKERAQGAGLWVDLVRVPPHGTWERRRADLYGLAEDWLGPPPPSLTPDDALDHLVRFYLRGFGPATRHDVASFTGLSLGALRPALERLDLERLGDDLLDLPGAPRPHPDIPAPVRFLPVWDASLLVHARRSGILPEEYRPLVFSTRKPHGTATFLVDGAVAGGWWPEDGHIAIEPFGRLDAATRRAVEDEAERLAAFSA